MFFRVSNLVILVIVGFYTYICSSTAVIESSRLAKRSTVQCEQNEMLSECSHCGPKTCDDLGHPIPCSGATAACVAQCVCVDGHVRNSTGDCILKKECPSCKGDPNAVSGCGNRCGNTCTDHNMNVTCFSGCPYNGCDCRPGYVFHEGSSKCILPKDC